MKKLINNFKEIKDRITKNFPRELILLNQWVCWNKNKMPINPRTAGNAQANNRKTWGAFDEACERFQTDLLSGVGFVFSEDDQFLGIDLDNCLDSETGKLASWAQDIIKQFDSYTEISPSGKGLHIFVKGTLTNGGKKKGKLDGKIEIYDRLRYFTVTGRHLKGTPLQINDRSSEVKSFYHSEFSTPKVRQNKPVSSIDGEHKDIIQKAMNAENGKKFSRLWNGAHNEYPSQSEADLALCQMLSFWADADFNKIDHLFRESGLYRPKWNQPVGNGKTYGEKTINTAIESAQNDYSPARKYENYEPNQETFNLTDMGNSERLINQFGDDIYFCHAWKSWLIWDGVRWAVDKTDNIKQKAKQVVRHIYKEAEKATDSGERKSIAKHAMNSESASKIKSMVQLAKSEIPIIPEQLDRDPWLLTCLNGTIDLKSGELLPHQRNHLITQLAPVNYDPEATSPLWDELLWRIMDGNENLIKFLQRAVGYSLTGETTEQCLFILFGNGANGKSTFLQAVSYMMGDFAKQTPTETLLVKHKGAISNDVARLKGARLITASEAEEGQRLAESLVKQMTGSDTISARFLHQEFFDFEPTHKIFLGTNHKPVIGSDYAIKRRIKLIPFEITIPEEERNKSLLLMLKEELPGILKWAVEGCQDWQKNGLGEPEKVKNATADYLAEMDVIAPFIEDCCVKEPSAKTTSKNLYEAYRTWCDANGEHPLKSNIFGKRLEEKGFESYRTGSGRGRKGLALMTVNPQ